MIPNGGYGLWNGEEMLIDNFGGSKWDQLRLYWRYGFSPQTTLNLWVMLAWFHGCWLWTRVNKALFKFQQQYFPTFLLKRERKSAISKSGFPWGSVNSFLRSLKLHDTSSENARDYFLSQKVSPGFVNEMINGVTRANYAQQVNQVHPLVSMVAVSYTHLTLPTICSV